MMKTTSMIRRAAAIAVLSLLALPALAAAGTVDKTVAADPKTGVEIECFSGSVTVLGWDRDEVRVTGTVEPSDAEVEIDASRKRVEITLQWDDGRKFKRAPKADLTINMPRGGEVSVEGVNLTIKVNDVDGLVDLQTVNGDLTVNGKPEGVEIESVNGTILVDGDCDDVDVESVSGRIEIRGGGGRVGAETVSGNIDLAVKMLREGDFSSVSGNIRIDGPLSSDAMVDIESHSGLVTLLLPASVSALFEVETFTGDIESAFGPGDREEEDFGLGKNMRLKVGGGDAEVNITTFSGDVSLQRK